MLVITVKVIAGSSQDCVAHVENDMLKLKCRAVPEKGKANASVIAILAKHYNVPKSAVKIIRGSKSSIKTVQIKRLQAT